MSDMTAFWADALRAQWGLDAKLSRLDGEYDLNFMVQATNGQDYVLKVMRAGCEAEFVDLQVKALEHIAAEAPGLPFPKVFPDLNGALLPEIEDEAGEPRLVWLLERLPGQCYAKTAPKSEELILKLGRVLGATDRALEQFKHDGLNRADFKWDLMQAGWIGDQLDTIADPERRALLSGIVAGFDAISGPLATLPKQAVHNDANDYNILVEGELGQRQSVSGLIDLGDMCAAPRICDLAIAGAYIVLDHPNPERALTALVSGYHAANRLRPDEVDLIWPLLRMRLAVSVVNSTLMAVENPDDPYVTISQAPAWRFLETASVNGGLMPARLRAACGLPVTDGAERIRAYLSDHRGHFAQMFDRDLSDVPMGSLSVENSVWPQNPFHMPLEEAARVGEEFGEGFWLGYYSEPRLIYAEPGFRKGPWKASDRRTVHLAMDVFAPAGTILHAPMSGRVEAVENRDSHLDYGGGRDPAPRNARGRSVLHPLRSSGPRGLRPSEPRRPSGAGRSVCPPGGCQPEWRLGAACAFPAGADDRRDGS